MNYTIKNGYCSAVINDFGAELISLKNADGKEFVWQNESKKFWKSHAPLLFPVCGRLKDSKYKYNGKVYDMTTHGFIGKRSFTLKEFGEDYVILTDKADEQTKSIYPFDYIFTAKYELIGKSLKFSVTIENKDDKAMPYMFGWHPGFVLPTDNGQDIEDYSLDFKGCEKLGWIPLQNEVFARPYAEDYELKNGKYIFSEDEIYRNDTLIFIDHKNAIEMTAKDRPTYLKMSWSENLPYLCIWKDPDNEAKFICLEPWSNVPGDGFAEEDFETRKMASLAPNEAEDYSYTVEI